MPGLMCHWNAQVSAWLMGRARSCGKRRWRDSLDLHTPPSGIHREAARGPPVVYHSSPEVASGRMCAASTERLLFRSHLYCCKHGPPHLCLASGNQLFPRTANVARFHVLAELGLAEQAGDFNLQGDDGLDHGVDEISRLVTHRWTVEWST